MSIAEFREKCKEFALEQIELQKKDFKRLGVRGDLMILISRLNLNMKLLKFVYLVRWRIKD